MTTIIAIERIKTVIDHDANKELTFDTATGELLAVRKAPQLRTHKITVDVGTQCRHPIAARTAEELFEILSVHDQWLGQLIVESDRLLDLMESGVASAGAVSAFRQILKGLAGRNFWFGRLADVGTRREVAELAEAGLIRITQQGGKTLPTKIAVHPWYGWRGDRSVRQAHLNGWLGLACGDT
ncbi:hypothetical protein D9M68_343550 [compost metagenome]